MRGRLSGFSLNRDGTQNITVTVAAEFGETYDELHDAEIEVEIKKAHKLRSLEANRYAWALIDQIAAKLHKKQSEVYREAIRDIGGVSRQATMKAAAVVPFREIWASYGLGNQVEIIDEDLEAGTCEVRIFHGSSTYDTAQMHSLLQNLIQTAEEQGIPTITPAEEARMLGKWDKKRGGQNNEKGNTESQDDPDGGNAGNGELQP